MCVKWPVNKCSSEREKWKIEKHQKGSLQQFCEFRWEMYSCCSCCYWWSTKWLVGQRGSNCLRLLNRPCSDRLLVFSIKINTSGWHVPRGICDRLPAEQCINETNKWMKMMGEWKNDKDSSNIVNSKQKQQKIIKIHAKN